MKHQIAEKRLFRTQKMWCDEHIVWLLCEKSANKNNYTFFVLLRHTWIFEKAFFASLVLLLILYWNVCFFWFRWKVLEFHLSIPIICLGKCHLKFSKRKTNLRKSIKNLPSRFQVTEIHPSHGINPSMHFGVYKRN